MTAIFARIVLAALLVAPACASAQVKFPVRPVTLVVPYAPGGGLDVLARFIAMKISADLGQPVIVENKPGANGAIAAGAVARSHPDGHTLFVGDVGTISINPALYTKLPYDPQKDLMPITLAVDLPLMLVTGANGRFASFEAFTTYARSNPAKVTFGSVGGGGIAHLTAELLGYEMGIDMLHIPYKGAPAVLNDVMNGNVDVTVTSIVSGIQLVRAGRLKALAVMGDQRAELLPEIQTVRELGGKDFKASSWISVHAPAGTPSDVVQMLNRSIIQALSSADGKEWMVKSGFAIVASSPQRAGEISRLEQSRWGQVIKRAKVEPN